MHSAKRRPVFSVVVRESFWCTQSIAVIICLAYIFVYVYRFLEAVYLAVK